MSVCSRSVGALSRSRLPPGKSLVPFLYQTATIQQWRSTCQPLPHRNASSRSKTEQDIPFENEIESVPDQDVTPSRKSTITGTERAAFGKLYKKFRAKSTPRNGPRGTSDEVADEYYEDDDEAAADANAATLDSLFDTVLANKPKGTQPRAPKQKKETMATLAQQILRPELDAAKKEQERVKAERAAKIRNLQLDERARVKGLLETAQTDRELWMVLEKEVLDVMKSMDLDGKSKQAKRVHKKGGEEIVFAPAPTRRKREKSTDTALKEIDLRDPAVFFPNFSLHIMDATKMLIKDFPSSPLPFTIIPTLKSLGRSAYILGATASLYRIVLHATWVQEHSYSRLCSLLHDMSNSGVAPDIATLKLLNVILDEYRSGRRGKLGPGVHALWQFSTISESAKQLTAWRDGIAERLGVKGSRFGNLEVVRKLVVEKVNKPSGLVEIPAATHRIESMKEEVVSTGEQIPLVEGESGEVPENGAVLEGLSALSSLRIEEEHFSKDRSSTVQEENERKTVQSVISSSP